MSVLRWNMHMFRCSASQLACRLRTNAGSNGVYNGSMNALNNLAQHDLETDVCVIGAGVVGLAIAKCVADSGRDVVVLETHKGPGMETSSRNSEVIHAGIYYPNGSLKSRLCVKGKDMLYEYASERAIPVKRLGKLVVAQNPEQEAFLQRTLESAALNGVTDLSMLSQQECKALEPELQATAGLYSPSSGIIDSHALMTSLQTDIENAGGVISFNSMLCSGSCSEDESALLQVEDCTSGEMSTVRAQWVINSGGLHASRVAECLEQMPRGQIPRTRYAKGNYFSISSRVPFSRLVYPVPEDGGLGAHLTLDMGGQAKFGPDVQWLDEDQVEELRYDVDSSRTAAVYEAIRSYWPGVPIDELKASYCGIRPKLSGPGESNADFFIQTEKDHGVYGIVNLFGIESPGLTSALALGEYVCDLVIAGKSKA